jgi:hypothetical protein
MKSRLVLVAGALAASAFAQTRTASVYVDFSEKAGTLDMRRVSFGQGGLSSELMWAARTSEIRALHPSLIRLFVAEYYDLMPAPGKYNFEKLDPNVDLILKTGATPLMTICFKPKPLYPTINQDVVEPNNWAEWEELVYRVVKHYKDRGSPIKYWEVANEPDIGESGGTPSRFTPENYVAFYAHTAAAVLRANPEAHVGGPALANVHSPLLPALLDAAGKGTVPLHFVSWHIYNSSPQQIRDTITYAKSLIANHPALHVETFLDEWNMSLSNKEREPRFQPAFVTETVWQMLEGRLDYSCYYHIRDYYVDQQEFARYTSAEGAAFMARWWNRMPQYDGLFDYQNTVRPTYYSFKLLSRLSGDRLQFTSDDSSVHGFATYDAVYQTNNILLWNFSPNPVHVKVDGSELSKRMLMRPELLDANAPSYDENARLRPLDPVRVDKGDLHTEIELDGYGVAFWIFEP